MSADGKLFPAGKPCEDCDCRKPGWWGTISDSACPICSGTWDGSAPCVGVQGAFPKPVVNAGGLNSLINHLRTSDQYRCHGDGTLGLYDGSGYCIPDSENDPDHYLATEPLVVNESTINNYSPSRSSSFPIQAIHKVWGSGGAKKYNRGVHSKNSYVSDAMENVVYTLAGSKISQSQRVLVSEAHGDLYKGTVPGLRRDGKSDLKCYSDGSVTKSTDPKKCPANTYKMGRCPIWKDISSDNDPDWNKRVGGCFATRKQYGPGVYNVLAYIPKTEDRQNNGRGYVWAMWPFSYAELYEGSQHKNSEGVMPTTSQYAIRKNVPCYNNCDGTSKHNPKKKGDVVDSWTCPNPCLFKGDEAWKCCPADFFSAVNHEIDIEIPSNSPQFSWEQMQWDTMNCNTWINDINNYDADTGAYYTQVAVQQRDPNKRTFISDEPETSRKKDYHWYTIEWVVDNDDHTNDYVAFYFDDPFDPSGTATIGGRKLPAAPTGEPLHKTTRFIPTRAGRLNWGPWMGWWGYGGKWFPDPANPTKYTPQFDKAKCRTAFVSITFRDNKATGFAFPQNYDQKFVVCDFKDINYFGGGTGPSSPSGGGSDPPKPSHSAGGGASDPAKPSHSAGGGASDPAKPSHSAGGGGGSAPSSGGSGVVSGDNEKKKWPLWLIITLASLAGLIIFGGVGAILWAMLRK